MCFLELIEIVVVNPQHVWDEHKVSQQTEELECNA